MHAAHKGSELRIVFLNAAVLDNAVLHIGREVVERSRRATPTTAKSSGTRPDWPNWYSAGNSLRLVRSPEAPKMTAMQGSGIRTVFLLVPDSEYEVTARAFILCAPDRIVVRICSRMQRFSALPGWEMHSVVPIVPLLASLCLRRLVGSPSLLRCLCMRR